MAGAGLAATGSAARAAELAATLALQVYTPEHMPFYHEKATRLLARIRTEIAERGG